MAAKQSVDKDEEFYYKVDHNFALPLPADYPQLVQQSKMTPKLAEAAEETVPDGSAGGLTGVIHRNPHTPFITITARFVKKVTSKTTAVELGRCLRDYQAECATEYLRGEAKSAAELARSCT